MRRGAGSGCLRPFPNPPGGALFDARPGIEATRPDSSIWIGERGFDVLGRTTKTDARSSSEALLTLQTSSRRVPGDRLEFGGERTDPAFLKCLRWMAS